MEDIKEIYFRFNNVTYTLDTETKAAICSDVSGSNTLESKTSKILDLYGLYKKVLPHCQEKYSTSINTDVDCITFFAYSLMHKEDSNIHFSLELVENKYILEYTLNSWAEHTSLSFSTIDAVLCEMDSITLKVIEKEEESLKKILSEILKTKDKFNKSGN